MSVSHSTRMMRVSAATDVVVVELLVLVVLVDAAVVVVELLVLVVVGTDVVGVEVVGGTDVVVVELLVPVPETARVLTLPLVNGP